MLAQAFLSILPPPTREESIEITRIWSSAGLNHEHPLINFRPFRSPHHSASLISLIGGGQNPKPGEISLAHRGVLFLDELPEFRRDALEALRQPLESGEVHVARAKKTLKFPARFIFIAAQNPCRCGYFGDPDKDCECSPYDLLRYQRRISGPLLDRLDIQLDVPRVPAKELRAKNRENQEAIFREKVKKAREIQSRRFANTNPKIYTNAEMSSKQIDSWVKFDSAAEDFLKRLLEKNFVSARGYYRILKVAQTIADLENSAEIKTDHLAEAFQYRIKSG
jgi:magnesium chelatase family protein